MRQIVLDTETTGLRTEDGHRIIEIGCVELINRKLTGNSFHRYINPQREIESDAQAVHGITQEFLKDKPFFSDIAQELIEFIKGAELIIHNAPFDTGFINYELKLLKQNFKSLAEYCYIIDTLTLARQLHVGQKNNLDALCKRYSIDHSNRELHGALLDANLLAQVYLAMTGGQGSLFEEATSNNEINQTEKNQISNITKSENRKLNVVKADKEELALHDSYLKTLKEQGKCLWPIE